MDSRSPTDFGGVLDPKDDDERQDVAETCVTKLKLKSMKAVVDRVDDKVNKAYGAWPDRLYLVGKDGKIAMAGGQGPFDFKPDKLEKAIQKELKKIKSERPLRRL